LFASTAAVRAGASHEALAKACLLLDISKALQVE